MSSPFDDDTFVRGMEAILSISKNSSSGLLGRLEKTDKEKEVQRCPIKMKIRKRTC